MTPTDELSILRDAIADVDRALLELLRRRMELAGGIGRIKAASGLPIVVRETEDKVLTRARQQAASCGVSEKVLEDIFHAIIRGSVERQHRVGIELREQRGLSVLIVGGSGGMGSWFREFFEIAGHTVAIADPALAGLPPQSGRYAGADRVPDLGMYDAILLASPLGRTPEILAQLVARRPPGLLVEITSIKTPLAAVLAQAGQSGVRVVALHPMFGPGKSPYEPLTFVLAVQRDPEVERREIEPLLSHPYTRLVAVPFPHHDQLMGWLLGLAHLTNMLFGVALTHSGIDPRVLHDCAST
ncbi:MAG: prephenate dehydrogenase/arogenate dehydrogenase family protein, partial [Acidobacteriota bacterium]|nr:prephenate dehydrogenase/arogenate dehydrogenase family protein [Acidobacteriota bacterium]